MPAPAFAIRPLRTHDELLACVEMQRATWGREFSDVVPPTILKITQRLGGVTAGAFADDGSMLGFVFGMTGVEDGRVVHWSDMLAVRPQARDLGVGRALKAWQREAVRAVGARVIYWTYDPLQAKNAHLNLAALGARVVEYVEDMYGTTDSDLHRGIGTDRFVVAWDVGDDAPLPHAYSDADAAAAVPLNPRAPESPRDLASLLGSRPPLVRVEIPRDIGAVQRTSLDDAARWRASTRAAFTAALARGYVVRGFVRGGDAGRGSYLLAPSDRHA